MRSVRAAAVIHPSHPHGSVELESLCRPRGDTAANTGPLQAVSTALSFGTEANPNRKACRNTKNCAHAMRSGAASAPAQPSPARDPCHVLFCSLRKAWDCSHPTLVKDGYKHIFNLRCLHSSSQYQLLYDHSCIVLASTLFYSTMNTESKKEFIQRACIFI